ncbi:glycine/sarcosine N-methyltransferase [Rhodothalassium salexigens DSM 2132]|uniref:Glycine/sarcosine N-methyltransferase n=1 Tax=Rhodothalassium salexigens DSM 2132 TaxID=1188247 RepID=A0A4R2PGH6_RHOSA|nr:class I SAM-dependent methyltransferase [Rhodothalassium salexigens]MBB4211608.1 SAM-dependent methyltransferase [Rhodothalassium salexigens DSM 2132]MBK1639559.1 SAM-dependent methyltransferase [Rhodothalassium salexigens DSM 2132]TCP34460.1 glycine/sarcosine N-methyltransferase [Rhodothalassium salexigens DSM 2132]
MANDGSPVAGATTEQPKPSAAKESNFYQKQYVSSFVEKWDELIDWDSRSKTEGQFFIDLLKEQGKETVLDVATGTGFHTVRLVEAGFDVTSCDGNAEMLAKAFENGKARGHILKTVQADWRWLNKDIQGKYDAIICLGNSFTHLFREVDRHRALAEFYAALKHDGILIIDQRNYDQMLDDREYSSSHKFYYCGEQVSAAPDLLEDNLARFKYDFPDGSSYHLNMFPLRRQYVADLLKTHGFQTITTYSDFQETHKTEDPDFFIHVAKKEYVADD